MGEAVTLRVAEAFQQDIGLGSARLDVQTRQRLKVGLGDVVEIRGRKATPAVVSRAQPDDEGKGLVRIEAVVRRNAGVSIGDRISVQRIDCPNADSVTIAPIYAGSARMDLGPGPRELRCQGARPAPVRARRRVRHPGSVPHGRLAAVHGRRDPAEGVRPGRPRRP